MTELFHATFSAVNIIPAILLTFVLFYWLLVILGALDISSFDFDVDIEAEVEFDADAAADATSEADISWFNNVLSFFNIDKIPLMVFITFWAIPLWAISVMFNHLIGNESFIISSLFLIPNIIISALIAKPLTLPFVKIFAALTDQAEGTQDLLGQIGKVRVGATDSKMGQGDVNIDGSNYRLNIKTKNGKILRGQQFLVVNYIKEGGFYIAEPYETID